MALILSFLRRNNFIFQILFFLMTFVLLESLWLNARGTFVERFVIDVLTVKPAVTLISLLSPNAAVIANGTQIRALGGGINIANGCEGTDALFLLISAITACPVAWRARAYGVLAGSAIIFALNQARIIALFYAAKNDKAFFDLLHHLIAPTAMIVAGAIFFLAWSARSLDRKANG